MNETQKARCQGCIALYLLTDTRYACKLFYKIEHGVVDGKAVQPKPKAACLKPKTTYQLAKAKRMHKAAELAKAKK